MHWVPTAMQSSELRGKYNLKGNCCIDVTKGCCCTCCALVQAEKEAKFQIGGKKDGRNLDGVVDEEYTSGNGAEKMVYQQETGLTEQERATEVALPPSPEPGENRQGMDGVIDEQYTRSADADKMFSEQEIRLMELLRATVVPLPPSREPSEALAEEATVAVVAVTEPVVGR